MNLEDYELVPVYKAVALVKEDASDYTGEEKPVLSTEYFYDANRWSDPEPYGYILKPKEKK